MDQKKDSGPLRCRALWPLAVGCRNVLDPGLIGFALLYSVTLSGLFQWTVRQSAVVEAGSVPTEWTSGRFLPCPSTRPDTAKHQEFGIFAGCKIHPLQAQSFGDQWNCVCSSISLPMCFETHGYVLSRKLWDCNDKNVWKKPFLVVATPEKS